MKMKEITINNNQGWTPLENGGALPKGKEEMIL
jgi:hypothetical protein